MENRIAGLHQITAIAGGFGIDELWDTLGTGLLLLPQYEPCRAEIEAVLPTLD